ISQLAMPLFLECDFAAAFLKKLSVSRGWVGHRLPHSPSESAACRESRAALASSLRAAIASERSPPGMTAPPSNGAVHPQFGMDGAVFSVTQLVDVAALVDAVEDVVPHHSIRCIRAVLSAQIRLLQELEHRVRRVVREASPRAIG